MKVQLAFNYSRDALIETARQLWSLQHKIILEIGNPLIKKHGLSLLTRLRSIWNGEIFVDAKITDGVDDEIKMYRGADYISVFGPTDLKTVERVFSRTKIVIDMLGIERPFDLIRRVKAKPWGVMLHLGRDEEDDSPRFIQFREGGKLKSKYGSKIWMAGGFDVSNFETGFFNGADVVVINYRDGLWKGFRMEDLHILKQKLLKQSPRGASHML